MTIFTPLFFNEIYLVGQITQWCIASLHIYIAWREWSFIQTVTERPPPVKRYMTESTFDNLKRLNQTLMLIEMVNESLILLLKILFNAEWSHISLWTYSTWLAGTSSEAVVTSVFIAVTTAKDFLLVTPVLLYTLLRFKKLNFVVSLVFIFLQFCALLVFQLISLNILVFICKLVADVSIQTMIYGCIASILVLAVFRELAVTIVSQGMFENLVDPIILSELRPVMKEMNFPEDHIYVMKMENPTDLPNAFTLGSVLLNNHKIVISDNVIGENKHLNECCSRKEVASIIFHELGHVFHKHTLYTALLETGILFTTLVFFILLHQDVIFEAFGFVHIRPIIAGLFIRLDLLAGYNTICALVHMMHLRRCEYQADLFSLKHSKRHLRNALIKLHLIQPKDLQTHDPLYSLWNLNHPCLIERLDNMHEHSANAS